MSFLDIFQVYVYYSAFHNSNRGQLAQGGGFPESGRLFRWVQFLASCPAVSRDSRFNKDNIWMHTHVNRFEFIHMCLTMPVHIFDVCMHLVSTLYSMNSIE